MVLGLFILFLLGVAIIRSWILLAQPSTFLGFFRTFERDMQAISGIMFFAPTFLIVLCLKCAGLVSCRRHWHDWWGPPPGHCRRCGYNLTGNESGVCPECATPVPKEANAA